MINKKKPADQVKSESKTANITKKVKSNKFKKTKDFFIVGIGASAGGLDAFGKFFQNMPDGSGMAFVLVPHLDPSHISLMPELIQKNTSMKVIQVADGTEVKPNSVYIVPPNHDLAILNGILQLLEPAKIPGPRMPIDFFFRSLAEDQGNNAICVILSGMGTDGTLGLRAIKGGLGMTMVQSEDSSKYSSMPKSAIETTLVDYVLPPEKMPSQLISYAKHAVSKVAPKIKIVEGKVPNALQKIFIILRSQTGHDFSAYKQNTICRRIERRMNVHQITKISTYVRLLQENSHEVEVLFKELLIGVTNFFRDKEAFDVLKEKALPQIFKGKPKDYTIRVWIPGCSSGEEAYSIAILLRECTEQLKQHIRVQIFATDIDNNAINIARSGIYPASISVDVSPKRLKRFFSAEDNVFMIKKDIREMLIFAPQDIIKDPPFTKLDLICCRNLLIYLDSDLQKKILPVFHYSLKSGGIMFLGTSETIGGFTDLFSTIDKKWKVFKKKDAKPAFPVAVDFPVLRTFDKLSEPNDQTKSDISVAQLAEKILLDNYAPPGVIVNETGEILYIHGRTGKYLEPAPGEAKLSIFEMAREGLKFELSSAIRKAKNQNKEVIYTNLKVKGNGSFQTINLTVRPIMKDNVSTGLLMIVFEDVSKLNIKESGKSRSTSKKIKVEQIETLEKELQYTRENLQTTIEELETSNEELKSTNEELQSTNEELQSTNEELETSKEEQQSINEELTTVNTELHSKIDELSLSNNDLKNLLDSIEIPTIFLDNNLCIKRFSSHTTKIVNLIQTDVGRHIGDIVSKLVNVTLTEDAEAVLKDLVFREKEVTNRDGSCFLMRTTPYRTTENVIDGVVISFMDLTKMKQLEEKERRLVTVVKDSNDAVTVQDFEGNILAWNKGAEKLYGYSENEALKMNVKMLLPKGKMREMSDVVKKIKSGKEIESFKTRRVAKNGKIIEILVTVTKLIGSDGDPCEIATTERNLEWLSIKK